MYNNFSVIQYINFEAFFIVIKGLEEKMMKKFRVSPDGRFIVFLGKNGGMHLLSAKVRLKIPGTCIFPLSLAS